MKNELICLWLDDIRPAPNGYIHARSVNEAKRIILEAEERGVMKFTLDLDHDLGDYAADGGDGIELVKWLAETKRYYEIVLHTMNPVGRQNMQAIVDRYWQKWLDELDELDETDTQVILGSSRKFTKKHINIKPIIPNVDGELTEYDFFTGEKLRTIEKSE